MAEKKSVQQQNLQGGMKAVSQIQGKGEPKIGIEEFLSVAERFGISEASLQKIRGVLEEEEMGEGPFLANYYSGLPETKVQAYERAAREVFGSRYAIATSSGTGALHAAFVAAGVGPGTEVICPAVGFMATASAVLMAKGVPVFCDIDTSLGIDPGEIEKHVTSRTVAIAPTHVMGSINDMSGIMKIAQKHDLMVVEDCAQSCGGTFDGRYIGTIGNIGVFSISAYKIVGGGEGGLLITDDERLWERASQLAEAGGLWRPDRFAPARYPGELFAGTNYRMSELEAAVDVVQIRKADAIAKRFRAVKTRILKNIKPFKQIEPQKINDPEGEVGYLLRFFPESVDLSVTLVSELRERGVGADTRGRNAGSDWHQYSFMYPIIDRTAPTEVACPYECPVYLERGGVSRTSRGDCPVADDLFDRVVSVKLNQWYTEEECDTISAVLNDAFSKHCDEDPSRTPWI